MAIDHNKLFKPQNIEKDKDVLKIDEIIEYEEILFAISEKIINYRIEYGLTQNELAKILKCNQTMISKLERGDYNPTFKSIYNISRKLDNSSKLFLEILNNIINKIEVIQFNEYKIKIIDKNTTQKSYCNNIEKESNLIEFKFNSNNNVGGDLSYEGSTSTISAVG